MIHGNYTKTGKPLLAGDPHLGNGLPTFWHLIEITYGDFNVVGSAHPGVPGLLFGKSPFVSWAITSALTDLSDLFKENISEDGSKYLVDG